MLGTQPNHLQPALFSYEVNLEQRVPADHLLRKLQATLDLSFVVPTVSHCYGRCGNPSLDPRLVMKLMLLLFLYDIPSERELMEQIPVRLDFLWFLGLDLDSEIPDHSVLSKARKRWGVEVFEELFVQTVSQCVGAGLVAGRLLHLDSTMVKANASKDSVISSGPELVAQLRQACQQQTAKLQVVPCEPEEPRVGMPAAAPLPAPEPQVEPAAAKAPVNRTHISTTDPEAELARSKNGVTELNYKDHRLVDDAHGVITAVATTSANVADGTQLPPLYAQHLVTSGLKRGDVAVAGDHHYGTASNYLFCKEQGLQPHLAAASARVEERGQLPLSQFVYAPASDRLRCPQGHYLVLHQQQPEEQAKVYLIEDPATCAQCPLRQQCTSSKRGRSVKRHVQADVLEQARAQAYSPAGRRSRKRRQHVMEGSFADAVTNHGAKRARWRGLWRQRIQSWLIAAVQNLRILLRARGGQPGKAAATLAAMAETVQVRGTISAFARQLGQFCFQHQFRPGNF